MGAEFIGEDLRFLELLLEREEAEIKVEIHHSKNHEYKELLKAREQRVIDMLARIRETAGVLP
jgi:hypothetical protein